MENQPTSFGQETWKEEKQCLSIPTDLIVNVTSKMLEKLLKDIIKRDLNKKGWFSANQYGFRAGRITIDAISCLYEIAKGERRVAATKVDCTM